MNISVSEVNISSGKTNTLASLASFLSQEEICAQTFSKPIQPIEAGVELKYLSADEITFYSSLLELQKKKKKRSATNMQCHV